MGGARGRMGDRARRIVGFARRGADWVPLSPLGAAVAVAAAAALRWLALAEMDLVVLVAGAGLAVLLPLSVVAVVVSALVLRSRDPGPPGELRAAETRTPFVSPFSLPGLRFLPLVRVRWEWLEPRGVRVDLEPRRGRLRERVLFEDRGAVRAVARRVVVEDAFGLARVAVRRHDPLLVDVAPHAGALGQLPPLTALAVGDDLPHPAGAEQGDRVELRRYVAGDPARLIHWKIYGRTRRLMVRMPERALERAERTVAYLVAGPHDAASAAAARVAIEARALGPGWSFGADGSAAVATRGEDALQLILRSVEARARGGEGLRAFLERVDRAGPAGIVLFVPATGGAWLAAVRAALGHSARRDARRTFRAIIGVDGLAPPALPTWRRLLVRAAPDVLPRAGELERVVTALREAGADVLVLDRTTGRVLGRPHRRAVEGLRTSSPEAA